MEHNGAGMRVAGRSRLALGLLAGAFGLGGLALFALMAGELAPDSLEGVLLMLVVLCLALLFLALGWSLARPQGGFEARPGELVLYGTGPANGLRLGLSPEARLLVEALPEDEDSGFQHLRLRFPDGLAVQLASSRDRDLLDSMAGALATLWGLPRGSQFQITEAPALPQPARLQLPYASLARPLAWLMLFGGLLALLLGTLLFVSVASTEVFGFLVGPFLGALGLLFLGALLLPGLLATRMLRQGQHLRVERRLGPWLLSARNIPVEAIETALVEPRGSRGFRLTLQGATMATMDLIPAAGRFGRPHCNQLPDLARAVLLLARGLPSGGPH